MDFEVRLGGAEDGKQLRRFFGRKQVITFMQIMHQVRSLVRDLGLLAKRTPATFPYSPRLPPCKDSWHASNMEYLIKPR